MISSEMRVGRQVVVVLEPGDDVMAGVLAACADHGIRQGYVPTFLGAFADVELIGTCHALDDPRAPLADAVHLEHVEGAGCGTLVSGSEATLTPHLHVSVGVKPLAATAYAGHLLAATVQYVAELVIVEVLAPAWRREPSEAAYGLANLTFTPR